MNFPRSLRIGSPRHRSRALDLKIFVCLLFILSTLDTTVSWAADDYDKNPPAQQIVKATDDGKLMLLQVYQIPMTYQEEMTYNVEVKKEVNGKVVTTIVPKVGTVVKTRVTLELVTVCLPPEAVQWYETDGKPVEWTAALKRLYKPTVVASSRHGQMIAPWYASVYKPGTLIMAQKPYIAAPPPPPAAGPPPQANRANRPRAALPIQLVSRQPAPKQAEEGAAIPDHGVKTPKSAAPTLLFARVPEPGKINLRSYFEEFHTKQFAKQIADNGETKVVYQERKQKLTQSESTQLDLDQVTAQMADGRPLTAAALGTVLQKAVTVLAATDGQPVDPIWLSNIKSSVVVVVPPIGAISGHGYGGYAGGMVAPAVAPIEAPAPPATPAPAPAVPATPAPAAPAPAKGAPQTSQAASPFPADITAAWQTAGAEVGKVGMSPWL